MGRFWNDESGAVVSAELILILTICICAVAVGWSKVAGALTGELADLGNAIGAVDQTFQVPGYEIIHGGLTCAACSGFGYDDRIDTEVCDCAPVTVDHGFNIKVDPTGGSVDEDGI